jgi:hypothetical protein
LLGKFKKLKPSTNKKPIADRLEYGLDLPSTDYSKYQADSEAGATLQEQSQLLELSTEPEVDPETQINLALDTQKIGRIDVIKDNVRSWERMLEVMPFWRNLINPVNITFGIITIISTFLIIAFNFPKLSSQPALFFSQITGYRIAVDKALFWVIPIFVMAAELILFRLLRSVFDFDRRLSSVLAFTQIFFNVILTIGLLQIISLVTI